MPEYTYWGRTKQYGYLNDHTAWVELTRHSIAIIDAEDLSHILKYTWCLCGALQDHYTAQNATVGLMHRWLLGINDPALQVDHVNRYTLDNRKANLRICTPQQNALNRKVPSNNLSGYKGVTRRPSGQYEARVTISLGVYDTPKQAAMAYDHFMMRYYDKEFVLLNEKAHKAKE